ncbi:PAS domain S-box protein [Lysinibacillus parviboronicapiens]|uniref:PAS domain S-box protein n=1 Tax=Lysinibacillus parviboronicapiens TaxID=436516 RepID=UPI00142E8A62|nr:PAS domain S-box protein [Lysinibacillus parviboronicapiens]
MQKIDAQVTDDLVVQAIERNVAIIRFDMNGKVAYVNEIFAKIMGYTVNEMIGKNHKEFQGNGIRLEATYMPVFANDAKKVIGVSKIATNITERQNAIINVADNLKQMSTQLHSRSEAGIKIVRVC